MIKRLNILMLLLVAVVSGAMAAHWVQLPLRGFHYDRVIATNTGIVYYTSEATLYSMDTEDNQNRAWTVTSGLSESDVRDIYYNYDKKYLFIAYKNGNIDLLFDDGRVVNLPDIFDAQLTVTREILDVDFGKDRIIVGTNFGIVIFDDKRMEVVETIFTEGQIPMVMCMNGYYGVVRAVSGDYKMRFAPMDMRHRSLDDFIPFFGIANTDLENLDDKYMVYRHDTGGIYVVEVNFDFYNDQTQPAFHSRVNYDKFQYPKDIFRTRNGIGGFSNDKFFEIGSDGTVVTDANLPEILIGNTIGSWNGLSSIWAAEAEGIGNYDIDGGSLTVKADRYKQEAITVKEAQIIQKSPDGERIYISKHGFSSYQYRPSDAGGVKKSEMRTNIIEDGIIYDVTSTDKVAQLPLAIEGNKTSYALTGGFNGLAEDPDDPDVYYIANYVEGVYKMRGDQVIGIYGLYQGLNNGVTTSSNIYTYTYDVKFDPEGNMWVFNNSFEGEDKDGVYKPSYAIRILPKAKTKLDPSTITEADWITHPVGESIVEYRINGTLTVGINPQSNTVFFSNLGWSYPVWVIDTKGTWGDPSDDTYMMWTTLRDQDNKSTMPVRRHCFFEDRRGAVWMGTTDGVYEFTKPAEAAKQGFIVRRIKVPRNDGTNLADYLLAGIEVYDIAEDASGRKWIATNGSGVYVVSEDGSEIYQNYTRDNSPLTTNEIYSVECDNINNAVYIGTLNGVLKYQGDIAQPKDDFSEVLVYPNPVRPEYYGMINISGLMDNALIKITDSKGNQVYQTRAEGGLAQWDGCNGVGRKVKSGVYYVFLTENTAESAKGAVAKIVIVN